MAAAHAVEHVGMPECALNLAQAAVYLALAPKSNASHLALKKARGWVRDHGGPPRHLLCAAPRGAGTWAARATTIPTTIRRAWRIRS